MRNTLTAIVLLLLCSCVTIKNTESQRPDDVHHPLPHNVYLQGGNLRLDLEIGKSTSTCVNFGDEVAGFGMRSPTSSHYLLYDGKSNKLIGIAESSITESNFINNLFYGTRLIEISDKNGDILIQEDMSDASPARRYIYLQRKADGMYKTFYLSPKYLHIPNPGDIQYFPPTIHLTDQGFKKIPYSTTPFTTN